MLVGRKAIGAHFRLFAFTSAESILYEGCGVVAVDAGVLVFVHRSEHACCSGAVAFLVVCSLFDPVLVLRRCRIVFVRTSRQR